MPTDDSSSSLVLPIIIKLYLEPKTKIDSIKGSSQITYYYTISYMI